MATYRLDIEYVGTDWHGWQIQLNDATIQGSVESALTTALRQKVSVIGSGRTDAGVHAEGQVAHFQLDSEIDELILRANLNGLLPNSIAVTAVSRVADDFHSRYDARWRRYRYKIGTIPFALDAPYRWFLRPEPEISAMNEAAQLLIGKYECSSFCRTASETENRMCEIYEASWFEHDIHPGRLDFVIRADRFLHGMVRTIVGTLIEIGHGKRNPSDILDIRDARDRTQAGSAAPAHGLVLEAVGYG